MRSVVCLLAAALLGLGEAYAGWISKPPTTQNLYGLWGNGADLYAVGSSGTILCSQDGGESWTLESSGTTEPLYSIWGDPSGEHLYVVGARGTLLYSSDRGKTWSPRAVQGKPNLRGVWGSSAQDVYAIGEGGLILHSQDGALWTKKTSGVSQELYGVWGSSAQDVYVVGEEGVILRSTDGGQTWTALVSGTRELLRGIWGSGPDDIYVVGYQNAILHSQDQGKTWSQQTRGSPDWLVGVWGSSAQDVYAVGAKGTILHSLDRGLSWSLEREASVSSTLYAVWGKSANEVFLVGQGGNFLKLITSPVVAISAQASEAEGAEVWIDGASRGTVPLSLVLPVGSHLLEVKKPGYQTFSLALELEARQTYLLPVRLELLKLVTLTISGPPSAEVFLDGVSRGKAPLSLSDVPPGTHQILLRQEGFQEWSRELFIAGDMPSLSLLPELTPIVDLREDKRLRSSKWLYGVAVGSASLGTLLAGLCLQEALLSRRLSTLGSGESAKENAEEVATHFRRMQVFGWLSFGFNSVALGSAGGGWVLHRAAKVSHKTTAPVSAR